MKVSRFLFHPDLDLFLLPARRGVVFDYPFNGSQSVKHLIEAAGVPHTEVGAILVNDSPVGFSYLVQDGDVVEIKPNQPGSGSSLQQEPRFLLDNHLGRLAAHLRMLGFDSLYRNDIQDSELAQLAFQEERILLTRDRRLLMRKTIHQGYWLRSKEPRQQVIEILARYNLHAFIKPFCRCIRCNGLLAKIEKETILPQLEPLTKLYFDDFSACQVCGQVYWKGSHYNLMQSFIHELQQDTL